MIACLGVVHLASAQKAAIKTNLLYDATTTFNLGAEFALSPKWTLDVSGKLQSLDILKQQEMETLGRTAGGKILVLQQDDGTLPRLPCPWR